MSATKTTQQKIKVVIPLVFITILTFSSLVFIKFHGNVFLSHQDIKASKHEEYRVKSVNYTIPGTDSFIAFNYTQNSGLDEKLHIKPSNFLIPKILKNYKVKNDTKFFFENDINPHLDARFGEEDYATKDRLAMMTNLFQSFAIWADENEIPYWISHGTLIGLYWNNKNLPWDTDFDLQVPANILYHMEFLQKQGLIKDRYLLEVNPNHRQRSHQKLNVIDARFIDTQSGLFIDITGLSNLKNDLSDDPILSCKSPHDYHYSYIFPLVRTEFEGVLSWRPFHVEKSLLDEYSTRSITDEYYKNYRFSHSKNEWVEVKGCIGFYNAFILPSKLGRQASSSKYEWRKEIINPIGNAGCEMKILLGSNFLIMLIAVIASILVTFGLFLAFSNDSEEVSDNIDHNDSNEEPTYKKVVFEEELEPGIFFTIDKYPTIPKVNDELFIDANSFSIPAKYKDIVIGIDTIMFPTDINIGDKYQIQELQALLRQLFRAWTEFADNQSLPYWISHETLLGWYWNYEFFPWTKRVDVQIPANLLYHLQKIQDNFKIDDRVNPNHQQRIKQESNNVDALFIDIKSGLFVEINGLTNFNNGLTKETVLSSKHPYEYVHSDIFPLHRTPFEGVLTWRPNHVEKCLLKEYTTQHINSGILNNYGFSFKNRKWVKLDECSILHKLFILPSSIRPNIYPKYEWGLEVTTRFHKIYPGCTILKTLENGESTIIYGYWNTGF